MGRFYGRLAGKGESFVAKQGTESSGITATINGWDFGIRVYGSVDRRGQDTFAIFTTGGSNASTSEKRLLTLTLQKDGTVQYAIETGTSLAPVVLEDKK